MIQPPNFIDFIPLFRLFLGIGCRLPGSCNSADEFYDFLHEKRNGIVKPFPDRWNVDAYYQEGSCVPGKHASNVSGFIDEVDQFDAKEFSISPKEADIMDPGQRLLLECARQALEDSGFDYRGTRTGVYVGGSIQDYGTILNSERNDISPYFLTSTVSSVLSNRISYCFDLCGPSITLDTACAASLTALHLAYSAIERNECDAAVVAGVNLILDPLSTAHFSRLGVLSKTGMCRAFDDGADGYVRGEGCGAVVVRRLEDAIKDGEHIYCIVRGSAVNSCGAGPSITMPSPEKQATVIREAYKNAGVNPNESIYVELHGTGTPVGDPIELKGAGKVFSVNRPKDKSIRIGSVKSSIGHLENGAGIASVIKVALMLDRNTFLPTRNHVKPNSKFDWENNSMVVQTETEPMPILNGDNFHIASVSGYGFGGSNCHVVFQSPPRQRKTCTIPAALTSGPFLFTMGGSSKDAVIRLQEKWSLLGHTLEPQVASTILSRRVRSYQWRSQAVGDTISDLKWSVPKFVEGNCGPIVMVFSGQGPQHFNMGRNLYLKYAAFRDSVNECDAIYKLISGGESVVADLGLFDGPFADPIPKGALSKVQHTVVSIVILQIALFDVYTSLNIKPDIVMGHSLGEIAMQYAANVLTKEGAIKLMTARATAMQLSDGSGTMMALGCNEGSAQHLIAGIPDLWIAAMNSPDAVTVAGSFDAINSLEKRIQEQAPKLFARKLRVTNAYHTPLMAKSYLPFMDLLEKGKVFDNSRENLPTIKVISTVTGKFMDKGFGPQYCWSNVIEAVRFEQAIKKVLESHPNSLFIEIANHPVLGKSIEQCGVEKQNIFCGMHRENTNETNYFLKSVGSLILSGVRSVSFGPMPLKSISHLPSYPYVKKKHWSEAKWHTEVRMGNSATPFAGNSIKVSTALIPWVSGHVVDGVCVFPGTGYQEICFQHGAASISEIHYERPLVLNEKITKLSVVEDGLKILISSDAGVHFSCRISKTSSNERNYVNINELLEDFTEIEKGEDFYKKLIATSGYGYEGSHQSITEVRRNSKKQEESLVTVRTPSSLPIKGFWIHPAILDSCMQGLLAVSFIQGMLVPYKTSNINRIPAYIVPSEILVHVVCTNSTPDLEYADYKIIDPSNGVVFMTYTNCIAKKKTSQDESISPPTWGINWIAKEWTEKIRSDMTEVEKELNVENADGSDSVTVYKHTKHGEMDLVSIIKTLPSNQHRTLFIVCPFNPDGAKSAGIARVLINEHQLWTVRLLHVDENLSDAEIDESIQRLQNAQSHVLECEMRISGGKLYVPRITRIDNSLMNQLNDSPISSTPNSPLSTNSSSSSSTFSVINSTNEAFTLEVTNPGSLTSLKWRQSTLQTAESDEVTVSINYAALNFKDVMVALKMLDPSIAGAGALGGEASGVVLSVGSNVKGFKVGDKVIAIGAHIGGLLSTAIVLPSFCIAHIPSTVTLEESAGIPLVFATAWYALVNNGHLKENDKVLIHSSAGAVGQAAIQICKLFKAQVFCTVGSEKKRDFLREAYGVTNFGNSHSVDSWSADVRKWASEGVDIVLNSLAGVNLIEGIRCLRFGGHFLEIGKRDFMQHSKLDMHDMFQNVSFHSVHIDLLASRAPLILSQTLKEVLSRFESGDLHPVVGGTTFLASQAEEAFRFMQGGHHLGKIILNMTSPIESSLKINSKTTFSRNVSYLLIGGAGAVGLKVIEWLVNHGAKNIVATARKGLTSENQRRIVSWALTQGADVKIVAADGASKSDMERVVNSMKENNFPLGGVMFLAMNLCDAPLVNMTAKHFEDSYAPKVNAYDTLASIVNIASLEHCIFFSSISSVMGNPGQSNYAAANAYFDALATHLPNGISLNLPPVLDVGVLATAEGVFMRKRMLVNGLRGHTTRAICESISDALLALKFSTSSRQRIIMDADWSAMQKRFPSVVALCSDVAIEADNHATAAVEEINNASNDIAKVLGLSVSEIDLDSPLIGFGLDSLTAVEISSILAVKWKVVYTSMELLGETTTMGSILKKCELAANNSAAAVKESGGAEQVLARPPLISSGPAVNGEEYVVSAQQEGIWAGENMMVRDEGTMNLPYRREYNDKLKVDNLINALTQMVVRHEILRTTYHFDIKRRELVQRVNPSNEHAIVLRKKDTLANINLAVRKDWSKSFDLSKNVFRATLFEVTDQVEMKWVLCMVIHHIAFDGFSLGIFHREFKTLYLEGNDSLSPIEAQYKDYSKWEKEWATEEKLAKSIVWWKQYLKGAHVERIRFEKFDVERQHMIDDQNSKLKRHFHVMGIETRTKVQALARKLGVTEFVVLLACYSAIAARHLREEEVVVGAPVAKRSTQAIKKMIGLFATVIPLRIDFSGEASFKEACHRILKSLAPALDNADVRMDKVYGIMAQSAGEGGNGDGAHLRYIPLHFIFVNLPAPSALDCEISHDNVETEFMGQVDMGLRCMLSRNGGYTMEWYYKSNRFSDEFVQIFANQMSIQIEQSIKAPELPALRLSLVDTHETHKLLVETNSTTKPFSDHQTLDGLMEIVCSNNPDGVALIQNDRKLTFGELDILSSKLSSFLLSRGVELGDRVCIVASRSIECVVSMLAINKVGASYVPIDTDYPKEQIDLILEDAKPKIILSLTSFIPNLSYLDNVIDVTEFLASSHEHCGDVYRHVCVSPSAIAYIIYTSGTTGKPKGVQISHTSIVNYIENTAMSFDATKCDGSSWFTSPSFDFSITALWGTLCSGATLRIIPSPSGIEVVWDSSTFNKFVDSFVKLTPTHVAMLSHLYSGKNNIKPLPRLILGGESVTGATIRQLNSLVPQDCLITNHYGPTESTVGCITFTATLSELNASQTPYLPIGKPVPNTQAYILDENMTPLPRNIAGNLYLGGVQLSSGYLNRQDLSTEKFVRNPYTGSAYIYKTGDTARFDTEGRIIFLGRSDRQVKHRGYRLELSEIESTVQSVKGIEAVHSSVLDGKLVVFIVPNTLEMDWVRKKVNKLLMRAVRPDEYVMCSSLPLTSHGKLDDKKLCEIWKSRPIMSDISSSSNFVATLSSREEKMSNIWKDLLQLTSHISPLDDFFELGGNSVLAAQMVSMANEVGFSVKLANVFDDASLRACAAEDDDVKETKVIVTLNKVEYDPNSKSPKPLFLIHPAGGSVNSFSIIANQFKDRKVFGLQWIESNSIFNSIRSLAAEYLREIKLLQPVGPYFLGGFSFGSALAWEIVKMMESDGDIVEKLLLIDGGPHTLHYVCVRNEDGTVEMKLTDHSDGDDIKNTSVSNIDVSGIRDLGLHFFYAEFLMSMKRLPQAAYLALLQTKEPTIELVDLVRENMIEELNINGLSRRMEEFLSAFTHHHLLLSRWRPSFASPKASTQLILAEHTIRNKAPLDLNMDVIIVKGEHHGSIMRSEVTIEESVNFMSERHTPRGE